VFTGREKTYPKVRELLASIEAQIDAEHKRRSRRDAKPEDQQRLADLEKELDAAADLRKHIEEVFWMHALKQRMQQVNPEVARAIQTGFDQEGITLPEKPLTRQRLFQKRRQIVETLHAVKQTHLMQKNEQLKEIGLRIHQMIEQINNDVKVQSR